MYGGRLQRLVSFGVLFEWGFEDRYHFGPLAMFSNSGRGESGAGRELTCQSWLGCGVWGEYLAEKDCAVRSCLWDGVSVVIV